MPSGSNFKVLKLDIKLTQTSKKLQTELADYVITAPLEVLCPDDTQLVITRDGFVACVKKRETKKRK